MSEQQNDVRHLTVREMRRVEILVRLISNKWRDLDQARKWKDEHTRYSILVWVPSDEHKQSHSGVDLREFWDTDQKTLSATISDMLIAYINEQIETYSKELFDLTGINLVRGAE